MVFARTSMLEVQPDPTYPVPPVRAHAVGVLPYQELREAFEAVPDGKDAVGSAGFEVERSPRVPGVDGERLFGELHVHLHRTVRGIGESDLDPLPAGALPGSPERHGRRKRKRYPPGVVPKMRAEQIEAYIRPFTSAKEKALLPDDGYSLSPGEISE